LETQQRLHQLDGLRAIAVSVVVLHHIGAARLAASLQARGHSFWANAIAGSSASGVELFFVLSGIVLLRAYLRQGRPLKVGVYARRRVQRLWPPFLAAWLIAGVVTWLGAAYPTPWTRTADLAHFDFASWFAQLGIVYVGKNAFNPAWWSLTVELLFYALVPLFVFALVRWQPTRAQLTRVWFACLFLAVGAQLVPSRVLPDLAWPAQRFAVHLSCFATGVLIAACDLPVTWAKRLASVGGVYVIIACRWPQLNPHVGWGLVYFALVLTALDSESRAARWLSAWPMVWLGERSYSLFLVHMSVFIAVSQAVSFFVPSKGIAFYVLSRALELPLALLASMIIFSVVERRFAHGLVSADAFWPRPRPARAKAERTVAMPTI
jgi:peptidoglycan/LPS O-acetylase OafA/YrhL